MNVDASAEDKVPKKYAMLFKKLARDGYPDLYSPEPTCVLLATNTGFSSGMAPRELYEMYNSVIGLDYVQTYPDKSYSFARYKTVAACVEAQAKFDQTNPSTLHYYIHTFFVKYVPPPEKRNPPTLPKGLTVLNKFINAEMEWDLLELFDAKKDEFTDLKNRSVLHFGHSFNYETNDAYALTTPIPLEIAKLVEYVRPFFCGHEADQITVNYYRPGQCIPLHVDTHSAFEETIISLSLQSYVQMDFLSLANTSRAIEVPLPARSLMIMTGESRYCYRHGIRPRVSDVDYDTSTIIPRLPRYSITFRRIRRKPCACPFIEYCDWDRDGLTAVPKNPKVAKLVEKNYVQNVYEDIAEHFSETRHSKWRYVREFLDAVPANSLIVDAGCGNGKYLDRSTGNYMIGFDACQNLLKIAATKGDVMAGSLFNIPLRSSIADSVICVAVVHHFSTAERRQMAIAEISRILKPGGRALITVWAFDQKGDSAYNKMRSNRTDELKIQTSERLPIHDGYKFTHADMLVPWQKNSDGSQRFRYYHLFVSGELEQIISSVEGLQVEESAYEEGNFIATFKKL